MGTRFKSAVVAVFVSGLVSAVVCQAQSDTSAPFAVTNTLKIGGEGGWDYVRVDEEGKLLYLPRTTHTMVVETATGKVTGDIGDNQLSHGVALVPAAGRGFISDGKAACVIIFDLKTLATLGKIKTEDDSDGIIYDPASDKVIVVCGDPGVMIPISPAIDPTSGKADAAIDLGGKPEYLVSDGNGKVFIALADKDEVAVVDTKAMKVLAHWPTTPGGRPTGMSMDKEKGVLFIGCRNQKMIVMSAKDGTILADLPIGPGVDATAFDHGLAFASCRDATLAVIGETSPGKYEVIQTVKTAPAARTMAIDPVTGKIYLATADMAPAPAAVPNGGRARAQPIPGTFKILVVEKTSKP
jgi:DNA-binding beta-propeller fold protein YncE